MEKEEVMRHIQYLDGRITALVWMCAHLAVLSQESLMTLSRMANEADLYLLYSEHPEAFREGAISAMKQCSAVAEELMRDEVPPPP